MENLASKYRPRTFSDVVAQKYVKDILVHQLTTNAVKNAYLFCGAAGCGKTTAARIFANDVNSQKGSPIELDAASNNGVDDIRDVIEDSKYRSMDSDYKVYIIDEVHMLSTGAFNALLKTLEEPPSGTIFILCTTDPQKIPATIMSRVQRYDFTRLPIESIVDRLKYIISCENDEIEESANGEVYQYSEEALEFIAKLSGGGMRDAISRLEKVLDYDGSITIDSVSEALGAPDYQVYLNLLGSIADLAPKEALDVVNSIYMSGKDLKIAMRNFTDFVVDVCKFQLVQDLTMTQIPHHLETEVEELSDALGYDTALWVLEELNSLNAVIKWEPNPKPIIDLQMLLMTREAGE